MFRQVACIISSVIYFSSNPLSYSGVRSVFTPDERALQTLRTIESIRLVIPEAKIVLIEMGSEYKLPYSLDELVDNYIYLGKNRVVCWARDSKLKGLGEAVGLIAARKQLRSCADYFIKISGRYILTSDFDLSAWEAQKFVVRRYEKGISTRLYGFPRKLFSVWQFALWGSIPFLLAGRSIEDVIPRFLPRSKISAIKKLGVSGEAAPSGEFISE